MQDYSLLLPAMTLKQTEHYFIENLVKHYDKGEAREMFYVAALHLMGFSRSGLMLHQDVGLDTVTEQAFMEILGKLISGRPVQYVTGHASFFGYDFKVTESVLIPRPETEELVDWIIQDNRKTHAKRLLDIGTGSGCIAISLKKIIPHLQVTALDISTDALCIAKENAVLQQAEIDFLQQDILQFQEGPVFDVIVSNPPYIKNNEAELMHQNVLAHEPHQALFVPDNDPLIFYRAIADYASNHLAANGCLFFEINASLGQETVAMLTDRGFMNIELRQDMQGKDRMIRCNPPNYADEIPK